LYSAFMSPWGKSIIVSMMPMSVGMAMGVPPVGASGPGDPVPAVGARSLGATDGSGRN
jgi:hypothetical protein